MTQAAVVYANLPDNTRTGKSLGLQIIEKLAMAPDVVILFISPVYNYSEVLQAVKQTCQPRHILGCSSAGEFTNAIQGQDMACAIAMSSDTMEFSLSIAHGLQENPGQAARELTANFHGPRNREYEFRSAFILVDALTAVIEPFMEDLTLFTDGSYQFFGGGAGDNAAFCDTQVFYGTESFNNAVVALEILSHKPVGIGMHLDWYPVTDQMHITASSGRNLISIDGQPAIEAFRRHARESGESLDEKMPLPYFLNNPIGIETGAGYKLRVPVALQANGSIYCSAELPQNATFSLMNSSNAASIVSAEKATREALQKLYGGKPAIALVFDCPASRLRMGDEFVQTLNAVQDVIHNVPYAGFNSHGQIVRVEGQYSSFHNCLPLVCLIPD